MKGKKVDYKRTWNFSKQQFDQNHVCCRQTITMGRSPSYLLVTATSKKKFTKEHKISCKRQVNRETHYVGISTMEQALDRNSQRRKLHNILLNHAFFEMDCTGNLCKSKKNVGIIRNIEENFNYSKEVPRKEKNAIETITKYILDTFFLAKTLPRFTEQNVWITNRQDVSMI